MVVDSTKCGEREIHIVVTETEDVTKYQFVVKIKVSDTAMIRSTDVTV